MAGKCGWSNWVQQMTEMQIYWGCRAKSVGQGQRKRDAHLHIAVTTVCLLACKQTGATGWDACCVALPYVPRSLQTQCSPGFNLVVRAVMDGSKHLLSLCIAVLVCAGAAELCAAHLPADHRQPDQDIGHPLLGPPECGQEPAAPLVFLRQQQAVAAYHLCRRCAGPPRQQQQQGGILFRPGHTPCSSRGRTRRSSSSWWAGQHQPARHGSGDRSSRHGCCWRGQRSKPAAGAASQTHGAAAGGHVDPQQPAAAIRHVCRHAHCCSGSGGSSRCRWWC